MSAALLAPVVGLISTLISTAFGAWVVVWVRQRGKVVEARIATLQHEADEREANVKAQAERAAEQRQAEADELRRDRDDLRKQMLEELARANEVIRMLRSDLTTTEGAYRTCEAKMHRLERRVAELEQAGH